MQMGRPLHVMSLMASHRSGVLYSRHAMGVPSAPTLGPPPPPPGSSTPTGREGCKGGTGVVEEECNGGSLERTSSQAGTKRGGGALAGEGARGKGIVVSRWNACCLSMVFRVVHGSEVLCS